MYVIVGRFERLPSQGFASSCSSYPRNAILENSSHSFAAFKSRGRCCDDLRRPPLTVRFAGALRNFRFWPVGGPHATFFLRLQMLCEEGHDGSACRSGVVGSRPHPDDSAASTVGKLIIELARSILRVEAVGRALVIAHCCPFA
jgi:hypothetical protein